MAQSATSHLLDKLNREQRAAVEHGQGPLLIIAGAGTGKTTTLVHRVAHLIAGGVDPGRVLLLTFTRRAAAEMLRRVDHVLTELGRDAAQQPRLASRKIWGGTFHAIATRLLRLHGRSIGLEPAFTVHDRADSEDLMHVLRGELNLAKGDRPFPRKGTCLSIYSYCVNSGAPLKQVLDDQYPWCRDEEEGLKRLFQAYVDRKDQHSVLDFDDLLLFWRGLVADETAGPKVRERFDCVLVDEYQDTNTLQADILRNLVPDGTGLTVVGDDAQSIYSFRAATVRNILDFPEQFPGTTVVTLEQNYRSTQPILDVSNMVIAGAGERYTKDLWTAREGGSQPGLVLCEDEDQQAAFIIQQVLEQRERGVDLHKQAVLFRSSNHSMVLEAELARHKIPFVKYGGLRFMETAHVKDALAFLRLAENRNDLVAGLRVLTLLPGIGPVKARGLMESLATNPERFAAWQSLKPVKAAAEIWPKFLKLLAELSRVPAPDLASQLRLVRKFYEPLLKERYDNPPARMRDLEQMEVLATRYTDRATMLAEIALDPPSSTEDYAGPPYLEEDYLILSTIHSAKGLEWDAVYILHAADGNIPSDMSTGSDEQIDEERRLFYVALTRAADSLFVCYPQRYYHAGRGRSDRHTYAKLTRFLPPAVQKEFELQAVIAPRSTDQPARDEVRKSIRAEIRGQW